MKRLKHFLRDGRVVSTVQVLGELWETMVLPNPGDYNELYKRRYQGAAAARAGHQEVVELLKAGAPIEQLPAGPADDELHS